MLPKINLEHLELLRRWGLRSSSLEAPGLHDTYLNKLSIEHSNLQGAQNCLDIYINKNMLSALRAIEHRGRELNHGRTCRVL